MEPRYDVPRIRNFLAEDATVFKRFCDYLSRTINDAPVGSKKSEAKRADLKFDALPEGSLLDKSTYLVERLEVAVRLAELVFHLANFWRKEVRGASRRLSDVGLDEDLFVAAQDLNQDKRTHKYVSLALDLLAEADESFAEEWSESKETLKESPFHGEYESLGQYVEHLATCRNLYAQAKTDGEDHRWLQAKETYLQLEEVQPGYRDVAEKLRLLSNDAELPRLDKILAAARTGWVYDERLPWQGGYPYRLFQSLGTSVTASSSMKEVQEALEELTPEDIKAAERASLETLLESEEQRLFVDLFLYPSHPAEETMLALERTFFEEGRLPEAAEIEEQYPADQAAVVLLLMDQPEAASAIWEKAQRQHPRDGKLAHCQGLLHLGQAHAAKSAKAKAEHWRRAIAQWAVALADHAYWVRWGAERSARYQRGDAFTYAVIENLGSRLRSHLEALLGRSAKGKNHELIEQLERELAIELEAVRLAQNLGGIAYEPGRLAFFGPLWTAHFGLRKPVAKHLASASVETDPDMLCALLPKAEILRRLRWYFSPLAGAAILLEGPESHARRSLAELEKVGSGETSDCSDPSCPVHGKERLGYPVCCPQVPDSLVRNAAYDGFDNPRDKLREDALQLAIEAHWCLAQAQIRQGKILDRDALEQEWQHLLTLAGHTRDPLKIRERLRNAVLAETGGTTPAIHSPTKCAELDTPIALIEFSLGKLLAQGEPPENQLLKTRLGEHLTHRAMHRVDDGDLPGAEADLKRTLAVAPHLHDSRARLAGLWARMASGVSYTDRFLALDYMRQAIELIELGQRNFPGNYDYSDLLGWLRRSRENLIGPLGAATPGDSANGAEGTTWRPPPADGSTSPTARLHGQATLEMREGRPELALEAVDKALELDPGDVDTQALAVDALLTSARKLSDEGEHEQALALVELWRGRLPTQEGRLEQQLQFLRFWPRLRQCLETQAVPLKGRILYQVHDHKEVWLPFQAKNTSAGAVVVRAQVEGENLRILALLPSYTGPGFESALGNLLLASREIVQFKVSSREDSELYLQGMLPFRMLDPQWFVLVSFGLSEFANLSRDHLVELEKLRTWFRETRDTLSGWAGDDTNLAESGKSLEKYCRTRRLVCERVTDVHYKIQANLGGRKTQVEMVAWPYGVRLAARLGRLRQSTGRPEIFHRLARLNAGLAVGKLALDDGPDMVFSVELPYLDNQAAADSFTFLERKATELRPLLL